VQVACIQAPRTAAHFTLRLQYNFIVDLAGQIQMCQSFGQQFESRRADTEDVWMSIISSIYSPLFCSSNQAVKSTSYRDTNDKVTKQKFGKLAEGEICFVSGQTRSARGRRLHTVRSYKMAIAKPASVRGQRKRGQEINDRAERNGEQFALNKIPYLIAAYFWSA
jgi:hypothetical protein